MGQPYLQAEHMIQYDYYLWFLLKTPDHVRMKLKECIKKSHLN